MIGAIIGDIVGSKYEFDNYKSKEFELLCDDNFFTDDTVMTLAIGQAINISQSIEQLSNNAIKCMQSLGKRFANCGYGIKFEQWISSDNPKPYNSYGNGSAMRVSAVGFVAKNIQQAKLLSYAVTSVTHDHPEGIKGAEAVCVAMMLARQGKTISQIKQYMDNNYYKVNFALDDIRPTYAFDESCQNTLPQALCCFYNSTSFEDAIRNAVSIGGDTDTMCAITGSIAEAYYGVPKQLAYKALTYLDKQLLQIFVQCKQYNKVI